MHWLVCFFSLLYSSLILRKSGHDAQSHCYGLTNASDIDRSRLTGLKTTSKVPRRRSAPDPRFSTFRPRVKSNLSPLFTASGEMLCADSGTVLNRPHICGGLATEWKQCLAVTKPEEPSVRRHGREPLQQGLNECELAERWSGAK